MIGVKAVVLSTLIVTTLGVSSSAIGAGFKDHNRNAPMDWDAETIDVNQTSHRVILNGDVNVRQDELRLTANQMTVSYVQASAPKSDPTITRIDAKGNVKFFTPDEIAQGNYGIYDVDQDLITLIGSVKLTRGSDMITGNRLTIDIKTGRSTIDARESNVLGKVQSDGRVRGRFSVRAKSP